MKKCIAEFIGTFALVFSGTGAIMINDFHAGVISHAGIALTFGLVVMAMIYTFGDISGAHLNPAVTIGFVAARRMRVSESVSYIASQLTGALGASAVLRLLFPGSRSLGMTIPTGSAVQSLILEMILSALLMLVILSVSVGAKEKGITAGMAIGALIALEAMFAGPVSGGSMNPARSLAPAILVGNHTDVVWIYLLGPIAGVLIAAPLCSCVREKGCCSLLAERSPT